MGCRQSVGCRRGGSGAAEPPSSNVREVYRIGGVLGCGAFGQVKECVEKSTKRVFAIKIMTKSAPSASGAVTKRSTGTHWSNEAMFRREIEILSKLDHPSIVKFYAFFEDRTHLYAILEKCEGGELFDYILKCGTVPEETAANLTIQMLNAVAHTHAQGYIHRDVKAENFLFATTAEEGRVKLIDFGMSEKLLEHQVLLDVCGSPHYLAPELIRRKYSFKADVWALGVLVYLMLFGKYPFDGPSTSAIVKEILSRKIDWNDAEHSRLSAGAQSLLRSLLQRNPDKRPSARDAMKHAWLADARRRHHHLALTSMNSASALRKEWSAADGDDDADACVVGEELLQQEGYTDMIVIGKEERRFVPLK